MQWRSRLILIAILMMAGCAGQPAGSGDEAEAQRKLDLARRLEASSAYREAAHEYTIIAEQYRATDSYPVAVRRAALLYASPLTPARDDTAALRWIGALLSLEVSEEERQAMVTLRALIQSLTGARAETARMTATADSLSAVTRRQGAALSAQMRRTADLEQQLQQTVEELRKLKEIDVQVSKSRRQR